MALYCGGIFAKVVLVIINIVYMVFGLSLSGFGVFFLIHHDKTEYVTGSYTVGGSVVLIVGGVFTLVIAILGIVAAAGELYPLLIAYIFFMVFLIGIHVVVAALSFYSKEKIQRQVEKQFKKYISEYRDPGDYDYDETVNDFVDAVQETLECCGLNGPLDWATENTNYAILYGVPDSCGCDVDDHDDSSCTPTVTGILTNSDIGIWTKGCNESLYDVISFNSVLLGGSAMGIVLVQIITVLISIALCACIMSARSQERRGRRMHSVVYTPLKSYPTNTITSQFESDVKM